MKRGSVFRNWAGNQVCLPEARLTPGSVEEVSAIVARAASAGRRVKAVGAGHSFTAAACTGGVQLGLDRLDAVESVDMDQQQVTVGAGIRLGALNRELAGAGLALPNLGDIAYQSIAGAISTATHGTGARLGNLATTVVGMEIVDGRGRRIWCDQQERPDLLRVARVGVGALGVVTRVRLQCVPTFDLHAVETIQPLDGVLEAFDAHVAANDHFELFWLPGGRNCQVKCNNRTREPRRPQPRLAYIRDKIVTENLALAALSGAVRRFPTMAPRVVRLLDTSLSDRDLIDESYRIFTSPRWVRFYEMEYSIARAAFPEAMDRLRAFLAGLSEPIVFPVEVRVSAADDIALSTGYGRDSAWIAVHVAQGTPYESYFQGVERIMDDYGGRPHWGKLHFQDHTTLAPRYPEWDEFSKVRNELDPEGCFANPYTDRVLGPPG